MSKKIIIMLFSGMACFLLAGATVAYEYYGTMFGGNGGNEYDSICNKGSMSGIRVKYAKYVDKIGTRCYQDSPVNGVMYGGNGGGSIKTADCSGTTPYAKGIRGRGAKFIDQIGLYCTDSNRISAKSMQTFGGSGGTYFSYTCANGYTVKGISGAAYKYVDSIGVVCSNRGENSTGE